MLAAPPLLRSPPFPGIAPAVAAVSRTLVTPGAPTRADLPAILRLLRTARVGGAFWAPPADLNAAATIVCVDAVAEAHARVTEVEHAGAPRPIAALLPDRRGVRAVAKVLRRQGMEVRIGCVDPWSWARPGIVVHARSTDERALIALAAGAELVAPDMTRASLCELLLTRLHGDVAYRDPFNGEPTSIEAAIAILSDWRRSIDANRDIAVAVGIARWKRRRIDAFLWDGSARRPVYARSARAAVFVACRRNGAITCWPSRAPAGLTAAAATAGVVLTQVEDGFIRSLGLGADLVPPWSVVVDPVGIYYDPAEPSALEQVLAAADFSAEELARATALIATIVRERVGKYAIERTVEEPLTRSARRLVLVVGQVEDDRSFRLGAQGLAGNLALLRAARAEAPDAEIWYRPHPDVEAGHRHGTIPDAVALRSADRVVRGGSLSTLLDTVDTVHVATSLTGFEALLRGREVVAHGQPFYAGWGLTRDLAPALARRGRELTLAQLVAGTLLRYPRYLDPRTGLPCPPEVLLDRLIHDPVPRPGVLTRLRRWQGQARRWLTVRA